MAGRVSAPLALDGRFHRALLQLHAGRLVTRRDDGCVGGELRPGGWGASHPRTPGSRRQDNASTPRRLHSPKASLSHGGGVYSVHPPLISASPSSDYCNLVTGPGLSNVHSLRDRILHCKP